MVDYIFLTPVLIETAIIGTIILLFRKNIKNKFLLYIEIFYALYLISFFFYPVGFNSPESLEYSQANLIPFKQITDYIVNKNFISLFGNMLIIFPLPILLYINKFSIRKISIFSLLIAIAIEPLQYILNLVTQYPNRIIDIDDTILRVIGVIFALVIIFIINKHKK